MAKPQATPPDDQGQPTADGSAGQPTPQVTNVPNLINPFPQQPPSPIPLVANLTNYGDRLTQIRTMLDSSMKALGPAICTLSVLAVGHFSEAAKRNNLGSLTPSEAVIGIDDNNRYLYWLPSPPKTPGATKIRYHQGQATANLYETFVKNDRLVSEDVREYYDVKLTPGPVTIPNVYTGWGIYVDLHDVVKEPIKRLSDEERASRAAKAAQTRAAKKAKKQQQQENQTPADKSEDAAE